MKFNSPANAYYANLVQPHDLAFVSDNRCAIISAQARTNNNSLLSYFSKAAAH